MSTQTEPTDTDATNTEIIGADLDVDAEDGMGSDEEKAVTEEMVVVPVFDQHGVVRGTYRVASSSASIYEREVNGKAKPSDATGDGYGPCRHAAYREPDRGCKHYQRIGYEVQQGNVPRRDQEVHGWVKDDLVQQLQGLIYQWSRLLQTDKRETVKTMVGLLVRTYETFRERVDPDAPPLAQQLDEDAAVKLVEIRA